MSPEDPVLMDVVEKRLAQTVRYCDSRWVDFGVARVLVRTNVAGFSGFRLFSRSTQAPARPIGDMYELHCIDLDHGHSLNETELDAYADRTFRGFRFRAGFYLGEHFGPPVTLITRWPRHYLIGRQLERVVWGWFTKYFLTVHSMREGSLHLKAACFVRGGVGVLLVGRGGGGKTVFLTQMCQDGAEFVSNSHVVVDKDGIATGVPSAIRIRGNRWAPSAVEGAPLKPHFENGEFIADPAALFQTVAARARVGAICVVDYAGGGPGGIEALEPQATYEILEQFALPISAYGMKDDVLQHVDRNFKRFVESYARMKEQLRRLVSGASCLYVNCDMTQASQRELVRARLPSTLGKPSPSVFPRAGIQ